MLIIEGSDLVGKTTLCNTILKHDAFSRYIYAHFTKLPHRFDRLWGYVDRMSRFIVQDRFHVSEPVYAEVRGEVTELTRERYRVVDAYLRLMGGYIVVVTADEDLIRSRWRDGEMYSIDKVLKANRLFIEVACEPCFYVDKHIHCTGAKPYADPEEIIVDYLRRQNAVEQMNATRPFRSLPT